jgi:transposase
VQQVLSPELRPGKVVVMDNLTTHKGERVGESIEGRGCELPYLQPNSPDFDSIEEAFAEIKGCYGRPRLALARRWRRRWVIAISAVSAQDGRGFFEHCGYRPRVQLLGPVL